MTSSEGTAPVRTLACGGCPATDTQRVVNGKPKDPQGWSQITVCETDCKVENVVLCPDCTRRVRAVTG